MLQLQETTPIKKLAIIGNPNAGKNNLPHVLRQGKLTLWGWTCDFIMPNSPQALADACAQLDPKLYEAAIVIGGDGTIHHAIRGLLRKKSETALQEQVPLFPFPAGTANDLAREMGLKADWNFVQQLINEKQAKSIDMLEVNGIPFATVAGVGLGALMTEEFNQRRKSSKLFRFLHKTFGKKVYTPLSVRTILMNWGKDRLIHVQSGFIDEKINTSTIFICNQEKLGTELTVAHQKTNTDQQMKVLIIPRPGGPPMLKALQAMRSGSFPEDFISFYTNELKLTDVRGDELTVFGDGEVLTSARTLNFKVVPQHLKIYQGTA